MELTIQEELAAQAIGTEALRYLKQTWPPERLAQEAESRVMKALEAVRDILDDDTLDDPECFYRIDAIVNALEDHGIYTTRHDF